MLESGIYMRTAELRHVTRGQSQIPGRAQELFDKWKKARKAAQKKQALDEKEFALTSTKEYTGDILAQTAEILGTQTEFLHKTIERFLKELAAFRRSA